MMLVRSVNGKLYAKILLDPADDRGPMRHWPGRTIAALQQLAAVQHQIDEGNLPPLPDFTAILNPHDSPQQFSRMDWCGFVPLLSNSRVSVENRDLMMPDFSFAPFGYLTNMIDANMSRAAAVPRGWPKEREAIYRSGRRLPWEQKQRDLFWRGGETHVQRRVYSAAIETGNVTMPTGIPADVILCGAHCSVSVGIPPEAWCSHKQLLSLPGHSFAVGFKYTLLCSSVVVRGAYAGVPCEEKVNCPRVYEQFWHAGLQRDEHFVASRTVADLSNVVLDADRRASAPLIASRSADYAYHVLDPAFISEYWHALLKGYAALFDWNDHALNARKLCAAKHRKAPVSLEEQHCFQGFQGDCAFELLGGEGDAATFVRIPSMQELETECSSTLGMQKMYRRFATVVPWRFTGAGPDNATKAARNALRSWMEGSYKKANRTVRIRPPKRKPTMGHTMGHTMGTAKSTKPGPKL